VNDTSFTPLLRLSFKSYSSVGVMLLV